MGGENLEARVVGCWLRWEMGGWREGGTVCSLLIDHCYCCSSENLGVHGD